MLLFGSASTADPFAAADSASSLSFSCFNSCCGASTSAGGASGSTYGGSGSNSGGTDASASGVSGASGAFVAKCGLRPFFQFDLTALLLFLFLLPGPGILLAIVSIVEDGNVNY